MRVKCYFGGARRGEGEDEGRITEGQGGAGAEETWAGNGWARGEVDRIETRRAEALSRVSPMQPTHLIP